MRLPIQPEWRDWAMREIERRYGPNPSDADRDIVLPPFINPMRPWQDAGTASGVRLPRRPMSIRKADDQYAVGLRPDGTAADRLRPLVDPNALFELLPQRVWPWIPIGVIVMAVSVVAATWALAAALT